MGKSAMGIKIKRIIELEDPIGKLVHLTFRPKINASVKNGEKFSGVILAIKEGAQQKNFILINLYNEEDLRSIGEGTRLIR
ncbi:MAG: hypothetical protein V3574_04195 [Candidatus Moraniibacteriota bacterium]